MDAAGGGAAAKTPVTVGEQEASGGCLCQAAPLAGRLAWPATGPALLTLPACCLPPCR